MDLPRSHREDTEPLEPKQPPRDTKIKTRKVVIQKVIEVVDLTED
jgi:hypothetical protein